MAALAEAKEDHSASDMFELNVGYKIPRLGFGTYKLRGNTAIKAIKEAISIGYR